MGVVCLLLKCMLRSLMTSPLTVDGDVACDAVMWPVMCIPKILQ